MNRTFFIVILLFWWLIAGCDETFEPWEENDQYHFSIFGYLDASADTQWVRVMPVREEFFLDPGRSVDAVVTLEHVESGESVVMNDSLFAYAHDVYAWNFWTAWELQPEQTYRITAEHPDGRTSHATVSLPADFPTPVVQRSPAAPGGIPPRDIIYLEGVERLADVRTIYTFGFPNSEEEYMVPFVHLQDTVRQASGEFMIVIYPREDQKIILTFTGPPCLRRQVITYDCETSLEEGNFDFDDARMTHTQIFIAAAAPDFHYFPFIDEKIVSLPEGISNVEHGTGYLAGIVSKTIPYESCMDEGMALIPCEPEPPPW